MGDEVVEPSFEASREERAIDCRLGGRTVQAERSQIGEGRLPEEAAAGVLGASRARRMSLLSRLGGAAPLEVRSSDPSAHAQLTSTSQLSSSRVHDTSGPSQRNERRLTSFQRRDRSPKRCAGICRVRRGTLHG